MPKIKILPVHPPPVYEKTIGEWIETLAVENHIAFKVMFFYITKIAKNIRFNSSLKEKTSSKLYYALEELTGVSRKIFF